MVASTAVDVCCRRPRLAELRPAAAVLDNSASAAGLGMTAHITPFSVMSSARTYVYLRKLPTRNLV